MFLKELTWFGTKYRQSGGCRTFLQDQTWFGTKHRQSGGCRTFLQEQTWFEAKHRQSGRCWTFLKGLDMVWNNQVQTVRELLICFNSRSSSISWHLSSPMSTPLIGMTTRLSLIFNPLWLYVDMSRYLSPRSWVNVLHLRNKPKFISTVPHSKLFHRKQVQETAVTEVMIHRENLYY